MEATSLVKFRNRIGTAGMKQLEKAGKRQSENSRT